MHSQPDFFGIIPARYESTRFPGKPLADILGRPMFWHVYQQASKSRMLGKIFLATDDERIYKSAENLNIPVLMTDKNHKSGTDRVLEAARMINAPQDSVIVNIQGDEPALAPEMLDQLLEPFVSGSNVSICTMARKITRRQAADKNLVKVVCSSSSRALYFSRSVIPFSHHEDDCLGHIGIYAFRMKYLEIFSTLGQSSLEKLEKLEQLRLLEADIPIHVVTTEYVNHGVDTHQDLINVIKILQEKTQ